jgi:hypothetical protein
MDERTCFVALKDKKTSEDLRLRFRVSPIGCVIEGEGGLDLLSLLHRAPLRCK